MMLSTLLATTVAALPAPNIAIETRTLAPLNAREKGVNLILNQRIVTGGRIVLLSRSVRPDASLSFSQSEYKMDGTPVTMWQEGFWSDRWNHFETKFGSKGSEQWINEEKSKTDMPDSKFRNPTHLWFWKVKPKVNDPVVVTFMAQNTIATFQIRFTYEGDEEMTLAGKKVTVHRVREKPLSAPDAVYTIWWYDDQGMGVKRYHKTTTNEYTDQLVAWK